MRTTLVYLFIAILALLVPGQLSAKGHNVRVLANKADTLFRQPLVRLSVRRIWVALSSGSPAQHVLQQAYQQLQC